MKSISRAGSYDGTSPLPRREPLQTKPLLACLLALLLSGCTCFQKGPDRSDPAYLLNYAVKVLVSYEIPAKPVFMSLDPIKKPNVMVSTASGSGSVFFSSAERSLVLTAAHVCHDSDDDSLSVDDNRKTVTAQRVEGKTLSARIIWKDKDQDLCVLLVEGYAGPAATLAQALPPLGGPVYFPGAPLGLFGDGVGFLGQGRYAGPSLATGARRILVSGTSTHGASGSGIYYQGQLVGVLLAVATQSGYIIAAAELDAVRVAVAAGLVEMAHLTQSSCGEKY